VEKVEPGSNAEKCGFRVGDCLVAVNNVPVRNERQASRILTDTAGDLLVLVEREMDGGSEEQRGLSFRFKYKKIKLWQFSHSRIHIEST
jgi:S1-C subfamily serine protease